MLLVLVLLGFVTPALAVNRAGLDDRIRASTAVIGVLAER
jgi:hypothetical protein